MALFRKVFSSNQAEEKEAVSKARAAKMAQVEKSLGWLGDGTDQPACPWVGECREHCCKMWDKDRDECSIILALRSMYR